jgi:hypothetical protein
MIPIPLGSSITVTMQGSAVKAVHCENCSCEFVYQMTRQTQGSGFSVFFLDNAGARYRASRQAEKRLKRVLESDCSPVPCPDCGRYQTHMLPAIRRTYCRWMFLLGLWTLVACAALFLVSWLVAINKRNPADKETTNLLWTLTAGAGIVGVTLIVARRAIASWLDPNASDPEQQKRMGQQLSIRKAEWERINSPTHDASDST